MRLIIVCILCGSIGGCCFFDKVVEKIANDFADKFATDLGQGLAVAGMTASVGFLDAMTAAGPGAWPLFISDWPRWFAWRMTYFMLVDLGLWDGSGGEQMEKTAAAIKDAVLRRSGSFSVKAARIKKAVPGKDGFEWG